MTRSTPAEKARLEHRDAVAAVIYPDYLTIRAAQKVKGAERPRITIGQAFWADEAEQKANAILELPCPESQEASTLRAVARRR